MVSSNGPIHMAQRKISPSHLCTSHTTAFYPRSRTGIARHPVIGHAWCIQPPVGRHRGQSSPSKAQTRVHQPHVKWLDNSSTPASTDNFHHILPPDALLRRVSLDYHCHPGVNHHRQIPHGRGQKADDLPKILQNRPTLTIIRRSGKKCLQKKVSPYCCRTRI